MPDDEKKSILYSLDEEHALALVQHADEQIEIITDLLADKSEEDILDLRVMSLLCDSFSSNYHIWRILKSNLNYNTMPDKEKDINIVAMSEQDLFMTENAILSKAFATVELLKLNYSLSIH